MAEEAGEDDNEVPAIPKTLKLATLKLRSDLTNSFIHSFIHDIMKLCISYFLFYQLFFFLITLSNLPLSASVKLCKVILY